MKWTLSRSGKWCSPVIPALDIWAEVGETPLKGQYEANYVIIHKGKKLVIEYNGSGVFKDLKDCLAWVEINAHWILGVCTTKLGEH